MNKELLRNILLKVKAGKINVAEALLDLKDFPYQELEFAKLDHHRKLRCGFPEVIYCAGKTAEQVVAIFDNLAIKGNNVLATRATKEMYEVIKAKVPEAQYYDLPNIIALQQEEVSKVGNILVMCAGTSDLPVAEEAVITAEIMGNNVDRLYDVGVAGLHRLLNNLDKIQQAKVLVVVAGMEGALPSVVGGLVDKPIIAVPTSIGYGANFGGLSALLGMLNSCAAGVTVVNIDNGFSGGYAASVINKLGEIG